MSKSLPSLTVALIAMLVASIARAQAQTPPAGDRVAGTPGNRPQVMRPAMAGTWSGTVIQVQRSIEYTVALEITSRDVRISYPELHCGGRLVQVGVSGDYSFFVETVTRGPTDESGRCTSGTISVARAGANLAWGWFGLVKGEIVVAYGMLSRKSDAKQGIPPEQKDQSITGANTSIPLPPRRKQRSPSKPPLTPR